MFGADWCPDARRFASVLALPQLLLAVVPARLRAAVALRLYRRRA
mgnify:CR=1 FL=1